MSASPHGIMTKSALALARTALAVAEKALPPYSHQFSPKKFTQQQHFAILAVRQFFGLDYRGVVALLRDWSDLRQVLGLKAVPHWTAVEKAEKRRLKKRVRPAPGGGGSLGAGVRPDCLRPYGGR